MRSDRIQLMSFYFSGHCDPQTRVTDQYAFSDPGCIASYFPHPKLDPGCKTKF